MNRLMTKNPDGSVNVPADALREFLQRGVAIPNIECVMFNTGNKKIYKIDPKTKQLAVDKNGKKIVEKTIPTLATVIYWIDGTKTEVVNSINDKLDLKDGKPTRIAKELGLIYAYAKRCMTGTYCYDANGNFAIKQEGFGRILNNLIDNAYDCQEAEAKKKAAKDAAAKRQLELKAAADAKRSKNPSLAETVRELKNCVDMLKTNIVNSKKTAPKKVTAKKPSLQKAIKKTAPKKISSKKA